MPVFNGQSRGERVFARERPCQKLPLQLVAYRFGNRKDASALAETLEGLREEGVPPLLRDLSFHCLLPLAHLILRELRSMGLHSRIPSSLSGECEVAFHRDLVRTTLIEHNMFDLLERCAEAGLRPMPLKGNYLAPRVYAIPEARPYRDIDLMIRAGDLEAMIGILGKAGYRPAAGGPQFLPPPHSTCYRRELEGGKLKVDVDLHLSMHWPREYDRRTRLDVRDIWSSCRVEDMRGVRVSAMSPEHLVISLCVDLAVNHRFARLLSLRDLFEVFSAMKPDFDELARWCRRWEVSSFVHPALHLLAAVAPPDLIPPELLESLRPRYPLFRLYQATLNPLRLPSMRPRSLSPRNMLFFLLADGPAQRAAGLCHIPSHLYNRLRHP